MAWLEVKDLHAGYGDVKVLQGVSVTVERGEIVTILGANGAGKTTLMRSIMGLATIHGGDVVFNGKSLRGWPVKRIVEEGLILIPEGRHNFTDMTVLENLMVAAQTPRAWPHRFERLDVCFELFPRLKERTKQRVGTMSGGEQQMVAVARGLMACPELLLLDEPSLGLAPAVVQAMFDVVVRIREMGLTVMLVEQNAAQALQVADRAYVLREGRIAVSGTVEELRAMPTFEAEYMAGM